jgi:hypothetical protein
MTVHTDPTTRVVLLGASNLTRGISTVVGMSRNIVGAPCAFYVAMGLGRSYGQRSMVLGRSLPGITECGLWPALQPGSGPVHALITDVGNDVIYGVPVSTIVAWVSACIDRLHAAGAKVVVTLPPIASIERLGPLRYHVAKSLLFPGRRMPLPEMVRRSRELSDGLTTLGGQDGVTVVEPEGRWYGLDPIHPRRRHLGTAWRKALGPWAASGAGPARVKASPARWVRLRIATPQRWWLLGRQMGRTQPSGLLLDGSTIRLY